MNSSQQPTTNDRQELELQKLRLEIRGLEQWWRTPLFAQAGVALLASLLTGTITITASYLTSRFQMSTQIRVQNVHDQRAVFARLKSRKFTTKQLYVSRYEALIFSDYHEERWKRAGAPKDSIDLQEAQRWMRRSEDLVFEIVKNNQALFEDLATAQALYPYTAKLQELSDRLYNIKALWTGRPPEKASIEQLAVWKTEAVRQLQATVDKEYGTVIEDLIAYLYQQLPNEVNMKR